MKKSQPAGRQGFTLIELLISIAIIAILTAIGIVSYTSINKRSRDAKRMGDLEQIRSALEMYRSDYGFYPAPADNISDFGPVSNLSPILVNPTPPASEYMPAIPKDPQADQGGSDYEYKVLNEDTTHTPSTYYGYCLAAHTETITPPSTCDLPSSGEYNYGVRQP